LDGVKVIVSLSVTRPWRRAISRRGTEAGPPGEASKLHHVRRRCQSPPRFHRLIGLILWTIVQAAS
jgi:hypothetical protein